MKKNKSVLALAVGALLAVTALTGCTQGQTDTSTASESAQATTDEVTLYVVRHGRTMLNTTDRVQGWSDAVLTPEGEEVVTAAGRGLADVEFQGAYSSDSGRAMQTANIILDENTASDVTLETDSRLREFNFGTWEGDLNENMWQAIADLRGITLEEFLATSDPEAFANSVAQLDAQNPEAAENWPAEDYATITARLTEGIDEIVAKEVKKGDGNVLVVSHGLSITALIDTLVPDFEIPAGGLKNASVTTIVYKDGEYSIGDYNDLSYVEKGTGF
ncbi:histidine phosphatase family protein [Microbacterium sp.]|uniref:histidine phosphatase family protein n=1 Tax=Microbacterium sp. TaxID=51671 RepID=UPI0039E5F595